MFEEILSADAKKSLAVLGESQALPRGTYLAGGTALALHFGHRHSYDFDFFTPKPFDEQSFVQRLSETISAFTLEHVEWRTILGHIGDTKFSLFYYAYPLLSKTHALRGIDVADVMDIAPMKIAAIADRGTKRDFVDLYFIIACKKLLTLAQCFELYDEKFKLLEQNKLYILKSLAYFQDAEEDEQKLDMIEHINWKEVKKFFEAEVKKVSKKILSSK